MRVGVEPDEGGNRAPLVPVAAVASTIYCVGFSRPPFPSPLMGLGPPPVVWCGGAVVGDNCAGDALCSEIHASYGYTRRWHLVCRQEGMRRENIQMLEHKHFEYAP